MADNQEALKIPDNENNEEIEVVTMLDVLKEEQEREDDATAVLGGSDEKNCTYVKGYLKRQALYACITCIPDVKTDLSKSAGICLACSYSCHEGHDLIELYTKRNFRCDCGNSKFGENKKCNLEVEKELVNNENVYNHNFCGLYCSCERPYPDPENNVVDDMIQCIICEDWYHCRHLEGDIPQLSAYYEMTCGACIRKHDFLLNYSGLAITKIAEDLDKSNINNVNIKVEAETESGDNVIAEEENSEKVSETTVVVVPDDQNDCKMPKKKFSTEGAKFWPDNWRQQLCVCKDCVDIYEKQGVSYLVDIQDTVHFYEEKGKARALEDCPESQYEQGLKALSSLDRVRQVEAITEYNAMKNKLKEYLQKFAENKKVVREDDIREFFTTMDARKKQRDRKSVV